MIIRKIYYIFESLRSIRKNREDIKHFQSHLLKKNIEHAYAYSSFYREVMEERSLRPEDFQSIEDLDKLPVTSKEHLHNCSQGIRTNLEDHKNYSSSGTTGDSVTIPFDETAADWREAITVRTELLKGYRPRGSIVEYWGMPQSRFGSLLRPKTLVPQNSSLQEQLELIEKKNPDHLIYSAHMLFRVAKMAKQKEGIQIDLKSIFSTGALLTPNMRETIEEAFETKVYDIYETSEVGQIGFECPEGGYHINEDLVHIEILDEDNEPVNSGERGKLTVTGLVNRSFPLLRYRIGDTVVKGRKNCSCKTDFMKIEEICGRSENILQNDKGDKVTPNKVIDTIASFGSIKKAILEKNDGKIYLRYEPYENFNKTTRKRLERSMSDLGFDNVEVLEDNVERSGWKAKPVRNHG